MNVWPGKRKRPEKSVGKPVERVTIAFHADPVGQNRQSPIGGVNDMGGDTPCRGCIMTVDSADGACA